MWVRSNERECVAFASSRNFKLGLTPREGTLCNFLIFGMQTFAWRVLMQILVANVQKTVVYREHTHTPVFSPEYLKGVAKWNALVGVVLNVGVAICVGSAGFAVQC